MAAIQLSNSHTSPPLDQKLISVLLDNYCFKILTAQANFMASIGVGGVPAEAKVIEEKTEEKIDEKPEEPTEEE